jgi:hypothetical protein
MISKQSSTVLEAATIALEKKTAQSLQFITVFLRLRKFPLSSQTLEGDVVDGFEVEH